MNLEYIDASCFITACYMSDGDKKIYPGEYYNYYHPIISEVEFKPTTDIKMVHGIDVRNNIETFDSNASNKRLNQRVKEEKKIDVTMGDIMAAPSHAILNFTDFDLVAYNSLNFPVILPPLETKALKEMYRGQIVIMTIYRLPTPANVMSITGTNHNYLDVILKQHHNRTNVSIKTKNLIKVLEFANKCWGDLSTMDRDYTANSIKVVTFSNIHQDLFLNQKSTESGKNYQDLYINDYDLLLTKNSILNYKINPSMNKSLDHGIFKDVVLHGLRYIYIVDRENSISDRYINIYGEVRKIPKLTKQECGYQNDGLYTGTYDSNTGIIPDTFVSLSEINNLDFIYTTIEEAQHGANRAELFNKELNEQRQRHAQEELRLAAEASNSKRLLEEQRQKYETERLAQEAEINRLKLERERQEAKFQSLKHNLESRLLREKNNHERWNYGMKNYFDERKYERENTSYKHESYIETLKTIAATAGVLATGFMLYSKLKKE